MSRYVEITATGELAEVMSDCPARGRKPAGVRVRRLNTGRSDFGAMDSTYTWEYPLTAVRPADMSRWKFVPASNRWVALPAG